MLCTVLQPAAIFDQLFQANSDVLCSADSTFRPWRLWDFVTLARVETYLLDTARALTTVSMRMTFTNSTYRALNCHKLLHAGELRFIHQIGH